VSETARELTAELLTDSFVPMHPVISPDGRWVAYVVSTAGVRERRLSTLWVVPADASSPPRRLTAGTAWDRVPRWAPDSASIVFLSDGQLRRIRLDGGDAEALTSWRAGISGHLPLADGRLIAVIARDEPSAEDDRRQAERDHPMVRSEPPPGDRYYAPGPARACHVAAGSSATHVTDPLGSSNGWYDLSVTISGDGSWSRRYAGHLEDGSASVTG
jgi:hypothetical protein